MSKGVTESDTIVIKIKIVLLYQNLTYSAHVKIEVLSISKFSPFFPHCNFSYFIGLATILLKKQKNNLYTYQLKVRKLRGL
jgi:hypothetical protein